jgi:hypothetical protein
VSTLSEQVGALMNCRCDAHCSTRSDYMPIGVTADLPARIAALEAELLEENRLRRNAGGAAVLAQELLAKAQTDLQEEKAKGLVREFLFAKAQTSAERLRGALDRVHFLATTGWGREDIHERGLRLIAIEGAADKGLHPRSRG